MDKTLKIEQIAATLMQADEIARSEHFRIDKVDMAHYAKAAVRLMFAAEHALADSHEIEEEFKNRQQ